ncbi:hypothetical protein ACSLNL_21890, partial [Escherichia coli]
RTIPSAMYTLIQTPGGESGAARLCIISIALAMISLLISEWLAIYRPGNHHAGDIENQKYFHCADWRTR